ncbi:AsmA-like C-terminal region-containing protein [Aquiflexum gelatinilyticum]|uniref:AsmA family protein n=1 Tax=Aquiflexum gelatinilyticum TaxID=2961943 RepID=UPI002168D98F|nr:AsmA-like C-terminal region-containing protein [Aquiflexum gelatinilyticum]MCS4435408.1 AsmA family protein [Aquiflexum gelatinilyticum]
MEWNKRPALKILKYSGLGFGLILAIMAIFPLFFKDKVNTKVKEYINSQVTSELRFNEINLTFFRHFPNLTVSLDEVFVKGAEGFVHDTLLYAKDVSFGVNLLSVFNDKIEVSGIYFNETKINILRDIQGHANFDIFFSETDITKSEQEPSDLSLEINNIKFSNSDFFYRDTDLDFSCLAENFDYSGKGNLKDAIVDLSSELNIQTFELTYENVTYLSKKRVSASLQTKIDTESTALTFERNHLMINELPVDFIGKLEFLNGGYDMNFILESVDTDFKDILTLIPDELGTWLDNTTVRGKGELRGSLQGLYLPEQNQMPNILMNLFIYNGFISHTGSSTPLEKLYLDLDLTVPELNVDKTIIALDSVSMTLGDGFVYGHLNIEGLDPAIINSDLAINVDLDLLDKALGIIPFDLKGLMEMKLQAKGNYLTRPLPNQFRGDEKEVISIPKFNFSSSLKEGYLKWTALPEAIQDISWNLSINSPDSILQNIGIDLQDFRFKVLDNQTKGSMKVAGLKIMDVDADLTTDFDLAQIEKFYPLDSGIVLNGKLKMDVKAKGSYQQDKKLFPIINSQISVNEGFIKTQYSDQAIENISFVLNIISEKGSYNDLKIDLQPIAFTFAGSPFSLKANVENLDDIKYEIQSQGRIDLGKLYQTFGVDGYELDGYLITDINLKGLQSDATKGRLQQLDNRGTIEMEKIRVRSDLFPLPFDIHSGKIRVDKDKLFLEKLHAQYAENTLIADGYLFNLIAYYADEDAPVKGNLTLSSQKLNLNDFMFYSEDGAVEVDTLGSVQGVVMIPPNVDFSLVASLDTVIFDQVRLEKFNGKIGIKNGSLLMENTGFNLVGSTFQMTGNYVPLNPFNATFDYHIRAKGFDIKRAYDEIPLFQEMVSAAEYAQGIASLDYKLSGRLDANMNPVLPSIKGEGIFALDKVKLKGFKLMNSIAKDTENKELADPELAGVQIKSNIANNLMTIERTRMRIAGFRPRFEGQVSLDGDMSIAFRLGLPPLGLFGIPIKITGNAENPNIEVGKITEGDELEETEDKSGAESEGNSITGSNT